MLAALAVTASLACGVPAAQAEYETPEVQVYVRGTRLLACHRSTGRAWPVGVRANDGMGTDESTYVNAVLARRWLWTSTSSTFAESADVREDTLTDLRTGKSVSAVVQDEDTDVAAVALPGALVVAGPDGVTARFIDGPAERLGAAPATAPATFGGRVYWREAGGARTATPALPAADPPRRKPRARTVGRCRPRANARLVLRTGPLVLSRVGGATWACRGSKQRRVSSDTTAVPLGDRSVQFFDGVLDVSTGKRRELAGMQVASDGSAIVGVASWGVSAWPNVTLAAGPASEPAVSGDAEDTVAYWLDGAAAPQMRVL